INDVATVCTLDTGARDSLTMYLPFLKTNPNVVPAKLTATGVNGFGVGGPALGQLGRLQSLSFGTFTIPNLIGDFTAQTQGALAMPFLGANVGGGVWRRFTMTLDYHLLTMTLTPNADINSPDQWDRSGVFLLNTGSITVIDVRPGTPAAQAGLVKGDVITAVNGSSTLSLHDVRQTFLGAPGTVVHLVVKSKDGTTRNVDLTLAEYV
ncbi:MAG TPA: PDZ domain-containing protein, partial [Candidatus Aquilonibacter sp.]